MSFKSMLFRFGLRGLSCWTTWPHILERLSTSRSLFRYKHEASGVSCHICAAEKPSFPSDMHNLVLAAGTEPGMATSENMEYPLTYEVKGAANTGHL